MGSCGESLGARCAISRLPNAADTINGLMNAARGNELPSGHHFLNDRVAHEQLGQRRAQGRIPSRRLGAEWGAEGTISGIGPIFTLETPCRELRDDYGAM